MNQTQRFRSSLLFAGLVWQLPTLSQASQSVTEFPVAGASPSHIASGPDGNLWFTDLNGNRIGRITTSGIVTMFSSGLSAASEPQGITAGPDGNMWFAEYGNDAIGRITLDGVVTEFPINNIGGVSSPIDITSGPDGNLWFTAFDGNSIGKISTTGIVTTYKILSNAGTVSITNGPDGNLWFTEDSSNVVGRITTAGNVTEFHPGGQGYGYVSDITTGPDGNLWFVGSVSNSIGRITPSGQFTIFPIVYTNGKYPVSQYGITKGKDGNIWFTDINGSVSSISTSGVITSYVAPAYGGEPEGIASGPDGNIWFTEFSGARIGKIGISSATPPPPKLGGYMSGNWYNPEPNQSGHGFQLEFTDQANTAVAIWFVYAPDGKSQNWIYAQGTYDTTKNAVTLPAAILTGAMFPPNFNSSQVHQTSWGTLTFTFSDCNTGTASWSSTVAAYGSGSIPISRLTRIAGTVCPQ